MVIKYDLELSNQFKFIQFIVYISQVLSILLLLNICQLLNLTTQLDNTNLGL